MKHWPALYENYLDERGIDVRATIDLFDKTSSKVYSSELAVIGHMPGSLDFPQVEYAELITKYLFGWMTGNLRVATISPDKTSSIYYTYAEALERLIATSVCTSIPMSHLRRILEDSPRGKLHLTQYGTLIHLINDNKLSYLEKLAILILITLFDNAPPFIDNNDDRTMASLQSIIKHHWSEYTPSNKRKWYEDPLDVERCMVTILNRPFVGERKMSNEQYLKAAVNRMKHVLLHGWLAYIAGNNACVKK